MFAAKIGILALYFVIVIVVGIHAHRKTKSVDDFVVGNRSISPFQTAVSYAVTNFSAGIFIGFSGMAGWNYGALAAVLFAVFGSTLLATYLPWKILAPKAREVTQRMNVLTLPSFFEKRYDSKGMRMASAGITFVFFIPYAASLLMGLSYLFEMIFNVPYACIVIAMAVVTGIYLFLGGYKAVTMVGMLQGAIMFFVALIVTWKVFSMTAVGGLLEGVSRLSAIDPNYVIPSSPVLWVGALTIILCTGLGPWGLPDMIQRFYGIESVKAVPKCRWIATIISLVIALCAYGMGATGHLFFADIPQHAGAASTDLIIPNIIAMLSPILGALFAVLILSASMSTLSAIILSASSSVSIDLIERNMRREFSNSESMILLRVLIILFLFASLLIALWPPSIMMNLITLTIGAVSGSFLAAFLYGLWSKNVTKKAAISGMVVGFCLAIIGFLTLQTAAMWLPGGIAAAFKVWGMPFFATIAMLVPMVVVPIVSHFTQPRGSVLPNADNKGHGRVEDIILTSQATGGLGTTAVAPKDSSSV